MESHEAKYELEKIVDENRKFVKDYNNYNKKPIENGEPNQFDFSSIYEKEMSLWVHMSLKDKLSVPIIRCDDNLKNLPKLVIKPHLVTVSDMIQSPEFAKNGISNCFEDLSSTISDYNLSFSSTDSVYANFDRYQEIIEMMITGYGPTSVDYERIFQVAKINVFKKSIFLYKKSKKDLYSNSDLECKNTKIYIDNYDK